MKKVKKYLVITAIIISVGIIVYGVGCVKYMFWRAEHPHAKTWTFFMPSSK